MNNETQQPETETETAETAETETAETETAETEPITDFKSRANFLCQTLEQAAPPKEGEAYGTFRYQEGVTKETFAERFGIKTASVYQTIAAIRDYLECITSVVEYNGKKMTGEALTNLPTIQNQTELIDLFKNGQKNGTLKIVTKGLQAPNFQSGRKRAMPKPTQLSALAALIAPKPQPQPETETEKPVE